LSPDPESAARPLIITVLTLWLLAAAAAAASGWLESIPPNRVWAGVVFLSLTLTAAAMLLPAVRHWLLTTDLRWLIGVHLTRLAGLSYLILYRRGALPEEFAVQIGWGEIAVALTSAAVIGVFSLQKERVPRSALAWNVFGLIELGVTIWIGVRVGTAAPEAIAPLFRLPLSLIVTFLIPIYFVTHAVLMIRLIQARRGEREAVEATKEE
jgi:hypothetical protein